MLDKEIVRWFLEEKIKDWEIDIPEDIDFDDLIEVFYDYLEDDTYEWLKENFKCFFNRGNPDWDWIRDRIEKVKEERGFRSYRKKTHKKRKNRK
jgi:hypothetical protein